MATKQAWEDFSIVGRINRINSDIQEIGRNIEALKEMKKEVMDNPTRKAEFKKILDQHFDDTTNTTTKLTNACTKLFALHTWLEDNKYL